MDDDVLPPPNNMVERPGRDRPAAHHDVMRTADVDTGGE
jgi:hypothetical protein